MVQSEVAHQELGHVKRHSARESTGVEWDIWGRDDALASQIAATRAGFGDVRFWRVSRLMLHMRKLLASMAAPMVVVEAAPRMASV
jgi:hypothetical protein